MELPKSGDPGIDGLVDLVTATLLYDGYSVDGVVSGGFYFEWTDEWWKADANNPEFRSKHVGDPVFTGHFPGCAYDHAWFGLNAISLSGEKYATHYMLARRSTPSKKPGRASHSLGAGERSPCRSVGTLDAQDAPVRLLERGSARAVPRLYRG